MLTLFVLACIVPYVLVTGFFYVKATKRLDEMERK